MGVLRRSRATYSEKNERLRVTKELLNSGLMRTEVEWELAKIFEVSTRQARRYITEVRENDAPAKVSVPKVEKIKIEGNIYVLIHEKTNLIKIGASLKWEENRSKQVGLEKSTKLLRIKKTESFRDIEVEMHRIFDEYRLPTSEWFHCDPEEAIKVFDRLIEKYSQSPIGARW